MNDLFRYCPTCGAAALKPSSEKSVLCSACGFEYFFNAAGAVAGLIVNADHELLVTIRAHEPGKGLWDLPGGFVDPGESAEEALRREVKEELNLDVESLDYLASSPNTYCYKQVTYPTVDMAYLCRISHPETMKLSSEIEAAMFVSAEQIKDAPFAFESIRSFAELFAARNDTGKLKDIR